MNESNKLYYIDSYNDYPTEKYEYCGGVNEKSQIMVQSTKY